MSITVTPSLATNTTFYKYEPFAYTFTGGSNFTVAGTLATYCVASTSNVVFYAVNGFQSTGSPFGETLAITSTAGTVPYTFLIAAGRFQIAPPTTSLVLYQGEPVMYTFTSSVTITNPNGGFVSPTLPPGLRFTYSNATTWVLSGTPTLTTPSTSYLFIGSNYTTGAIVSTLLPIQVLGQRIVLTASSTSAILTIGTPFAPSPVFSITAYPLTASSSTVAFRGTNLPPGLTLSTVSGALPGASAVLSGTPTSNTDSTLTSTITASVIGLSSSSTVAFTYATVIVFTAPTRADATFYAGIPASLQVTAVTLYPSGSIGSYSSDALPDGLQIDSVTGLISGTPATIGSSSAVITAFANVISNSKTLNITVASNTLSRTIAAPSTDFTLGLAIQPITITFFSAAGTSISCTSNLPSGLVGAFDGSKVTLSGIPALVNQGNLRVTATTLGALPLIVDIPYTTTKDTFTFSALPSTLLFRQNIAITPIQFSAVALKKSAPIVYFTNTAAIPTGLYVTPAGVLQGTPTVVVPSGTTFAGLSATNGYDTIISPPGFTYTVLADEVLATSASVANALVPSAPVNIPLTLRTLSGIVPTGNVTFSCYTYGLTATAAAVGGALDLSVVPPSYTALTGTLSGLPIVFGLGVTNTQTITRYTLRWTGSNYYVCRDNGAFGYSDLTLLSANTMVGYTRLSGDNSNSFLYITSNAPTVPLPAGTPIFGPGIETPNSVVLNSASTTFYEVTHPQFNGDPSVASNVFYYVLPGSNVPRDFQWQGNTFVIADGTSNVLTSSNSTTFSLTVPNVNDGVYQCIYSSALSKWVALTSNTTTLTTSLVQSGDSTPSGWASPQSLGAFNSPRIDDGGFVLRASGTRFFLGGTVLRYYDLPATDGVMPSINIRNVRALVPTQPLVMGGDAVAVSIQYSTDNGISWTNGTNTFTTRTTEIVSGSGGWLAVGSNGSVSSVKYSSNGMAWVDVGFPSGSTFGPIQFDGMSWCVFAGSTVYRHDPFAGNIADGATWTTTTATFQTSTPNDVLYTFPPPIITGGPPVCTLYIGETPNGPTFVSPTITLLRLYQYVVFDSLVFTATAPGGDTPVYFLASTPPAGMLWDPATATLSGRSVQLGTFTVDVYAQSMAGVSKKTVTFIVSQVLVSHTIPTAAAYTAYTREKVIADAATATVNDHSVPFEVGPFLLNRPPNKVTAPEICCLTRTQA